MEEGPPIKSFTEEERKCEAHYNRHTIRNEENRYVVALPFKHKIAELGESKNMGKKRLLATERKLYGDPELERQYHAVLNEYLTLGHMTPIAAAQSSNEGYYLPHHAVIKQSSLTTKVRVVFDGSAKTTSGISLNDTLLVGPTIQPDIFTLLIRFRKHAFVLTGDIEKMYPQVLVRQEDRKYQRILWRTPCGQLQTYELNTVTFGLSSAPYLAIRTLHQLAEDEKNLFPRAAKVLKEDFYVDEVLTGAATRKEAISLRKELTAVLKSTGFTICQ
ncbi:uncharacterized protein LOC124416195 [Diprion similis]|uniref:uncharacterized protein LOC124416195 n=1 Tax=Diprion similis TaxID=362088 RepID=UPI001EF80299|nr:uncharacterized protein LOC124416195 [Diprion similis]